LTNATTGSEQVAPGQEPPAGESTGVAGSTGSEESSLLRARFDRAVVQHWQFGLVVLAAAAMRVIVVLGYPPILWFDDSYNYIQDAITRVPDEVRPNGYPFFLQFLLPLHSDYAIGLLQAAMGVGVGVAIYALLRHRGLPWWGAALPALPVLFDSYEMHLEHQVAADVLFVFLVTIAVVMLCWNDKPSVLLSAVAGLIIGYATIVRSVGYPLLIVVVVCMLVRRAGWRRLGVLAVAGIVPIAAYMLWFHQYYGKYALTESSGSFLYSRVSTFAECQKISNLPPDVRYLCDPTKPEGRPAASEYIWADNELGGKYTYTPLYNRYNSDTSKRFTVTVNAQAKTFAERAIEAQPVTYLRVVLKDILHTFGWNRQPDPAGYLENANGNGPTFQFVSTAEMNNQVPWYALPSHLAGTPPRAYCDANCRKQDAGARQIQDAERQFAGKGLGITSTVAPWATFLQNYQRFVYLRGSLLLVIVLIGAAGVVGRWRRWGGVGLLPWLTGVMLIVLPPMTAGFSYRYVLAAAPVACLAAGLAFAGAPGGRATSVRALAADLRRYLGRGVAVDQE
jgi:hypothetical protein